jgi:mercuric ion binding protein
MTRLAPILILLLALALVANAALTATSTVVLAVEGMTWGTWPIAVKKALEGLKGVNRADVSFRAKEAVIAFDPEQVTVAQMVDAVTRAGFQASVQGTQRSAPPQTGRWSFGGSGDQGCGFQSFGSALSRAYLTFP